MVSGVSVQVSGNYRGKRTENSLARATFGLTIDHPFEVEKILFLGNTVKSNPLQIKK
jgi:hypothetical protein